MIGLQSTIDRPESVKLVKPPITIIKKVIIVSKNNHKVTEKLGLNLKYFKFINII